MGQRAGLIHWCVIVIAGFFTGGALAIRGGMKAARNSAIGCGILLAVIEGVGIGIQRMMAENTRLDVRLSPFLQTPPLACDYAHHFLEHGLYLSILPRSSRSFKNKSLMGEFSSFSEYPNPRPHLHIISAPSTPRSSFFLPPKAILTTSSLV